MIEKSITHFEKRGIKFVIAGNGSTYFYFQNIILNNHDEADTMIINLLWILQPVEKDVVVHSVDTDVFTLLLRHYERFLCKTLFMILVGGYVNLTTIAESLGITVSRALLSLHALTNRKTQHNNNNRKVCCYRKKDMGEMFFNGNWKWELFISDVDIWEWS